MNHPEQEARDLREAHALLARAVADARELLEPCITPTLDRADCPELLNRLTAFILAEREKLNGANARADGARAAALREAASMCRSWVTTKLRREFAWRIADTIEAIAATPPTSAATTGRETP